MSCGASQYYPRGNCTNCMSADLNWAKAGGKGKVYTYSVVHVNRTPEWADRVPYVELDEEVRVFI